jgi:NADH dehydrogenase (ubiquinone) flavoprotein 2
LPQLVSQRRAFGGGIEMRHEHTDYNHTRMPWDFTMESYAKIDKIMAKFPRTRRRSGVIPLLHLAQVQHGGWIPVSAMYKIAKICEVPPMDVFQTVTFYAMFNRKPVGKYHLQFCVTTPCMLRGCDELIHACEHYLGVKMFGTTADGLFTVGEMECMGCCVNAPMVVVSDYSNPPNFAYDFYEDLDYKSMIALIENLRAGRPTRVGSQLPDRKWSEPQGGKTTLKLAEPPGPFCRDLNAPPAQGAPPPPPPARKLAGPKPNPIDQVEFSARLLPPTPDEIRVP